MVRRVLECPKRPHVPTPTTLAQAFSALRALEHLDPVPESASTVTTQLRFRSSSSNFFTVQNGLYNFHCIGAVECALGIS